MGELHACGQSVPPRESLGIAFWNRFLLRPRSEQAGTIRRADEQSGIARNREESLGIFWAAKGAVTPTRFDANMRLKG
jgi:hypothetical protein